MENDTFVYASGAVQAIDRRERKLIAVVSLAVAALAAAVVVAWLFGVWAPRFTVTGGSASVGSDVPGGPQRMTITADVTNDGALAERVVGLDLWLPWLKADGVRSVPASLGPGESGQLVIEAAFDCAAPQSSTDGLGRVQTARPWGTASSDILDPLRSLLDFSFESQCGEEP